MSQPQPDPPHFEQDPFPRMIIVVVVIAIALFFVIAGIMAYDFISRASDARVAPVHMDEAAPPAPDVPGTDSAAMPVSP